MQSDQPTVYQVSDLLGAVKRLLTGSFRDVQVEGELSNVSRPASGHWYFSLREGNALLRCVMWRGANRSVGFIPEDGQFVRIRGAITVYEARGDMQLQAHAMVLAGEGALLLAFEKLKRRLEAEGLFDPATKKPLPALPRRIGVVTSGTGAAVQDLLSVLGRRYPLAEVLLVPVRVQGPGAADEIVRAIRLLNARESDRPDVLIVGRGGGSLEDLWAFNEERVARAIFASEIPLISAVGHETDFSIADFVADVRAATPSEAAEIAVPDIADLASAIRSRIASGRIAVERQLERARGRVGLIVRSHGFNRADSALAFHNQRVDDLILRLDQAAKRVTEQLRVRHGDLTLRLSRAAGVPVQRERGRLKGAVDRLVPAGPRIAADYKRRVQALSQQLFALNPLRPLDSGFALVERGADVVRSAGDLTTGERVSLRFRDGKRDARIEAADVDEIGDLFSGK